MQGRRFVGLAAACSFTLGACSSSTNTATSAAEVGPAVVGGKPFPADRCAANRAAGTIRYISGYDFAASASIIDVLVAKQRGYFDDLCLDVRVSPGIASDNYAVIDAGMAEFSSGGSFSELTAASLTGKDQIVALAIEGKAANDTLIVKKGRATGLGDLRGTTIGVKKTLPASINAMLAKAGLRDGKDYTTKVLDGFDPLAHIALTGVVGFTGFASNEPGQLDRAGISYDEFDPSAEGIPGSFGVVYSNRTFLAKHPTAATDFMRATLQGLSDAVTDPVSASMVATDFIENNGNPNGLSAEGEAFRWQTESKLVVVSTPKGEGLGVPDLGLLQDEIDAYSAIGVFGDAAPTVADRVDLTIAQSVYDVSGMVIWPAR